MMKRYITTGLAACLVGYVVGASAMDPAAVLRQSQGKVFVSQGGSAMALAQEGMPLYAGNRVITVSGSRAEVAYSDGCTVALPENSLLAVKGSDQCRLGQAKLRTTSGFQSTPIGQAGTVDTNKKAVAEIIKLEGTGLIGQSPVPLGTLLYKGSRITAGPNSKVVIRYSNGCEDTIEANQSLEIGDPPNCSVAGGVGGTIVGSAFLVTVGVAIAQGNDDGEGSPQ